MYRYSFIFPVICDILFPEVIPLEAKHMDRRLAAVKTADAINAIEGAPVSDYAKTLSAAWTRGELTGEQMKSALLASHRKMAGLEAL